MPLFKLLAACSSASAIGTAHTNCTFAIDFFAVFCFHDFNFLLGSIIEQYKAISIGHLCCYIFKRKSYIIL